VVIVDGEERKEKAVMGSGEKQSNSNSPRSGRLIIAQQFTAGIGTVLNK
jgi:hypothetical protein